MKFLVDMQLSPNLASWINENGHEGIHVSEIGLAQSPDSAILERARFERRVVVTADLDYPRLLALEHADGPGLILMRGGYFSEREAVSRLQRVFAAIPLNELETSIVVVDQNRIRRRRLPLNLMEE